MNLERSAIRRIVATAGLGTLLGVAPLLAQAPPAERFHPALDHVQPDTPAGHVGDGLGRRQARDEHQCGQVVVVDGLR